MLPMEGVVDLPHGLPGEACLVDGTKDPLLFVRSWTQLGVSILFPSVDRDLERSLYFHIFSVKLLILTGYRSTRLFYAWKVFRMKVAKQFDCSYSICKQTRSHSF